MSNFKRSQRKYVKKTYRVRNWHKYEAGLRERGSLTVWISLTDGELGVWPFLLGGAANATQHLRRKNISAKFPRIPELKNHDLL